MSQWRSVIDVNLLGLSICTKEALQSMEERGVDDGHVIHISRCSTFDTSLRIKNLELKFITNTISKFL